MVRVGPDPPGAAAPDSSRPIGSAWNWSLAGSTPVRSVEASAHTRPTAPLEPAMVVSPHGFERLPPPHHGIGRPVPPVSRNESPTAYGSLSTDLRLTCSGSGSRSTDRNAARHLAVNDGVGRRCVGQKLWAAWGAPWQCSIRERCAGSLWGTSSYTATQMSRGGRRLRPQDESTVNAALSEGSMR